MDGKTPDNYPHTEASFVESWLLQEPSVRQAKLLVLNNGTSKSQHVVMISFATSKWRSDALPDGEVIRQLRKALLSSEPSMNVLKHWVVLDDVPVLKSGELDQQRAVELLRQAGALPASQSATALESWSSASVAEQELAHVMSSVAKIPIRAIQPDKTFVQLGGDSLQAIEITTRLLARNFDIKVADILSSLTLAELASTITPKRDEQPEVNDEFSLLPAHHRSSIRREVERSLRVSADAIHDVYPCVPTQESFMDQSVHWPFGLHGKGGFVVQFVYTLSLNVDIKRFQSAWNSVVNTQPILRTRFVKLEHGCYQVVLKPGPISWHNADDLAKYLEADKLDIMDYGDPLIRWGLVSGLQPSEVYFIWTAHHAVWDGWSLQLILSELEQTYSYGSGPKTSQTTSRIPFSNFVRYIGDMDREISNKAWIEYFSGTMYSSLYPFPLLTRPSANAACKTNFMFPETASTRATPSMIIYASWAIVQSSVTGSPDVVLRLNLSGRDTPIPGIENMIAPAVHVTPLRIHVDLNQTSHTFLEGVQTQISRMRPYQLAGYQNIRSLNEETKSACDAATLIVVQPQGQSERISTIQLMKLKQASTFLDDPYAFGLEFTLGRGRMGVEATFDPRLFSEQGVEKLLSRFQSVFMQLITSSDEQTLASSADTSIPQGEILAASLLPHAQ